MYIYSLMPPGVPRQEDELEDAIIIQGASLSPPRASGSRLTPPSAGTCLGVGTICVCGRLGTHEPWLSGSAARPNRRRGAHCGRIPPSCANVAA